MSNNVDICFVGEIIRNEYIDLKIKCTNGKYSQCEKLIIPGSVNLNGRNYVVMISHNTFDCLVNVREIHLSKGVFIKSGYPFYLCPKLNFISVDPDHESYSSINGVLYNKELTKLIYFPLRSMKNYTLPKTVVDSEQVVSRYFDMNFEFERIIKKRKLSLIIDSLKRNAIQKQKRQETERNKSVKFQKVEIKPNRFDDVKDTLIAVVSIAVVFFSIVFVHSFIEDYKESQKYHFVPTNAVKVNPINVRIISDDEEISTIKSKDSNTEKGVNRASNYDPIVYPYNPVDIPGNDDKPSSNNNEEISRWESHYRESYRRMEEQAQNAYNSLTVLGGSVSYNNQTYGVTGRTDSFVATQINDFKKLQRDMANLRNEASLKGITISQSHWETVQVSL